METPLYQVDSFTSQPFKGNPAGVCILSTVQPDSWMQNVALEMNVAETAFPLKQDEGYNLRWFTPRVEVDLCGHATLAAAHILWETGREARQTELSFSTRSGLLSARINNGWIELNFPRPSVQAASAPEGMLEALGVQASFVGHDGTDYLVELESDSLVRSLQPNFGILEHIQSRGVIVTARSSSSEYDFVSRFFAPQVGIPEDPVTGSAHCGLATYWGAKLGKQTFLAYQASARGGELRLRIKGGRVVIGGQAVTTIEGKLKS